MPFSTRSYRRFSVQRVVKYCVVQLTIGVLCLTPCYLYAHWPVPRHLLPYAMNQKAESLEMRDRAAAIKRSIRQSACVGGRLRSSGRSGRTKHKL